MSRFLYLFIFLFFVSCHKKSDEHAPDAVLEITIAHLLDGKPLVFNTKRYKNTKGNAYNVQEFKYYLSNLKLRNKTNGRFYHLPESYYLVQPTEQTHRYTITAKVPPGIYNEIEFAIGVDNAKNHSLDNVGALDPSNNMVWDWNTGYKFLLLEGDYYPEEGNKRGLVYHIGTDANYRTLKFPLSEKGKPSLSVGAGKKMKLSVSAEVSEIFTNPTDIDFRQHNVVMFEAISARVADNYAKNMFRILETKIE